MVSAARPPVAEPVIMEKEPLLGCISEQFTEREPPFQEASLTEPQNGCSVDW